MVKPDVDRLLTVPDDPPAAGPDRALDAPPLELLLLYLDALDLRMAAGAGTAMEAIRKVAERLAGTG
jgi:hypothetical protein